jgi:hypothetical protein
VQVVHQDRAVLVVKLLQVVLQYPSVQAAAAAAKAAVAVLDMLA